MSAGRRRSLSKGRKVGGHRSSRGLKFNNIFNMKDSDKILNQGIFYFGTIGEK